MDVDDDENSKMEGKKRLMSMVLALFVMALKEGRKILKKVVTILDMF